MKFSDLQKRFSEGTLTTENLEEENVTPSDFFKMRQDTERFGVADGAGVPRKLGDRTYGYVFVTESAIGQFKDLPLSDGWNLDLFRERKSPVLFGHDHIAEPVGRALTVRRGVELGDVKAMTGHVEFAPEGLSPKADLVEGLVANGFLSGGSVGFDINKAREPTEEEVELFGLGKYSTVFTDMSLVEYSVVTLGRDPKAGVIYSEAGDAAFEQFLIDNEGVYEPEAIREVREELLRKPSGRSTFALREWFERDAGLETWQSRQADELTAMTASVAELVARVTALESMQVPDPEPAQEDEETLFGLPLSRVIEVCKQENLT